jgi:hypothetical protein
MTTSSMTSGLFLATRLASFIVHGIEGLCVLECSTVSSDLLEDGWGRHNVSHKGRWTLPSLLDHILKSCVVKEELGQHLSETQAARHTESMGRRRDLYIYLLQDLHSVSKVGEIF